MLKEGDMAPGFTLKGSDGKDHSLSDLFGRRIVLYFYPKDDTAGCTIEAKDFTKFKSQIEKTDTLIFGISKDSYESHCSFTEKHKLGVTLLSDPDAKVINSYDAWGNKGVFGEGIIRKTFIIDKGGKILKIYPRVQAIGHAEAVLEFLKGLGA